ncbi:MAG: hypothetical protein ABI051_13760 [Vicinamibacterales bacterium]
MSRCAPAQGETRKAGPPTNATVVVRNGFAPRDREIITAYFSQRAPAETSSCTDPPRRRSLMRQASMVAAWMLAFGTLMWPYGKFGFNAAITAGARTGGVYGLAVASWCC